MADDSVYADLLDSLSPLTKAGIDPDEARMDRRGTMARLLGTDAAPAKSWADSGMADEQQADAQQAQAPQMSQRTAGGGNAPSGQAPAAPPASTSVTPDGGRSPSLVEENRGTLSSSANLYRSAAQQALSLQGQPDLDAQLAPDRAKLDADTQKANASPYVPGTATVKDEYKPSFGQRLVRGFDGFARAGVLGIVDPTLGGGERYGAPNRVFKTETAQAAKAADADKQRLAGTLQAWKERQDARRANARELGALAVTGKDVAGANLAQQEQPNRDAEAAARTQDAYNTSPEGKAEAAKQLNEQTLASRQAQIADPKNPISRASRADQAFFAASGKMPAPDHYHAPLDQLLFNQAHAAWQVQNPGQKPTLDALREMVTATQGKTVNKGGGQQEDDDASAIVAASVGKKEEFAAQYDRNPSDGSYTNRSTGSQLTGQQFDDRVDQFRKDANLRLSRKGYQMDAQGNVVALHPPAPAPASAPGPAPAAQSIRTAPPTPVKASQAAQTALPPASLLQKKAEGDLVHGKGGETFRKEGGRWVPQP